MNECVEALKRGIEVIDVLYQKVQEDQLQTQTLNSINMFNPSKKARSTFTAGSSFASSTISKLN